MNEAAASIGSLTVSPSTSENYRWHPAWIWLPAFVIASLVLSLSGFQSESNDSKFYNRLVVQLNERPVTEWIAPLWGENFWGHPPGAYIRDHLVGHLIPGAILARLGFPADQALGAVQLLFQILSLFLMVSIAKRFVALDRALHLLWILQLIPIAFTHGLRANHEQAMFFFLLLAIHGGLQMPVAPRRSLGVVAAGAVGVFLIKGAPGILVPPMALAATLLVPGSGSVRERMRMGLRAATVAYLAIGLIALAYEAAFRGVTGLPFFSEYWRLQLAERSLNLVNQGPWLIQKGANFGYYVARAFYYSFPWVFIAIVFAFRKNRNFSFTAEFWRWSARSGHARRLSLVLLWVALSVMYIALFSYSNRTASRYVFPTFFFLPAASAVYLAAHSVWLRQTFFRVRRWGVHRVSAALWLGLKVAHIGIFWIKDL